LRGDRATIQLTGARHRFLEIHGSRTWHAEGAPSAIADAYVPSGASGFHVSGAATFQPGDRVLIEHPVTEA
jgi:hypothetical protein